MYPGQRLGEIKSATRNDFPGNRAEKIVAAKKLPDNIVSEGMAFDLYLAVVKLWVSVQLCWSWVLSVSTLVLSRVRTGLYFLDI